MPRVPGTHRCPCPHHLTCLGCPASLQATAAALLPLRDENSMKGYLLAPAQRRALLQQQGGRLEGAPRAALGLEPLLQVCV